MKTRNVIFTSAMYNQKFYKLQSAKQKFGAKLAAFRILSDKLVLKLKY